MFLLVDILVAAFSWVGLCVECYVLFLNRFLQKEMIQLKVL